MNVSKIIKWSLLTCLIFNVFSAYADGIPSNTNKWTGAVSAGLTLTRGNSQTTLASLTAAADYKTPKDEWSMGADAIYGDARVTVSGVPQNTTTAQSADGFVQYNRLFSDRFYALARLDGLHDDIADIHYRTTLSPGVGYYFIKNKTVDFSGELGPGYVSESLGSQHLNFATMRVAEKFHLQLSDRARLWESAQITPDLEYIKRYIITFEIGVEADLNAKKNLTLQCYLDDNYNSIPAPGNVSNDLKLVMALAYKF